MLNLTLYGTGSATADYIAKHITSTLDKAGIDFVLDQENKVDSFLLNKIESIPAIQFEDKIFYFNQEGLLSTNLRVVLYEILESHNYGKMPKIYCHIEVPNPSISAIIFAQKLATSYNGVVKLNCTLADTNMDYKHAQKLFYQLVDSIESEWGSDIFSSAIIEANFSTEPKNLVIEKQIKNDKPVFSIIPHINNLDLEKYQRLTLPEGTVLNKIPDNISQFIKESSDKNPEINKANISNSTNTTF